MADEYGYKYGVFQRKPKLGRIYWCCEFYQRKQNGCRTKVVTKGDEILKQFGDHNHDPTLL